MPLLFVFPKINAREFAKRSKKVAPNLLVSAIKVVPNLLIPRPKFRVFYFIKNHE